MRKFAFIGLLVSGFALPGFAQEQNSNLTADAKAVFEALTHSSFKEFEKNYQNSPVFRYNQTKNDEELDSLMQKIKKDGFNYEDPTIDLLRKKQAKKDWKSIQKVTKAVRIKWKDFTLDSLLVFKNFGFDSLAKYELYPYHIYYFLTNEKNGGKFVAEANLRLYDAAKLYQFTLISIHEARDLQSFILLRSDVDYVESHPDDVTKYLKKQGIDIEKLLRNKDEETR